MNIPFPAEIGTNSLEFEKQSAESIIEVFQITHDKVELMENLTIYLEQFLYNYYQIDKSDKVMALFIKEGLPLSKLVVVKEAIEDSSHKYHSDLLDLIEIVDQFEEDDAIDQIRDWITTHFKKKKKKRKKKL